MARLLENAGREFENLIRREVERLFEENRTSPNPSPKIPIIGEMLWVDWKYDPHGPRKEHAKFMELAVKALIARKWFETQLPPFMQPLLLPLCEDERIALNGTGDRRLSAVANYSMLLLSMDWEYQRVRPFIDYYAD